jgi:hypothetical protein
MLAVFAFNASAGCAVKEATPHRKKLSEPQKQVGLIVLVESRSFFFFATKAFRSILSPRQDVHAYAKATLPSKQDRMPYRKASAQGG